MSGILVTLCDATTRHTLPCYEPRALRKYRKVVKLAVEKVRRPHLGQGAHDGLDAARVMFFPVGEHLAEGAALQVLLRAAEVAGNDREALLGRVGDEVRLGDVGEWADDDMAGVVRAQLRWHRLQLAAMEKIEEKSREDVVAMMEIGRASCRER